MEADALRRGGAGTKGLAPCGDLGEPRGVAARALLGGLLLMLLVTACPKGTAVKKELEACTELGQQCQLEPGKLGACSYKANCQGAGCLYCQSQH